MFHFPMPLFGGNPKPVKVPPALNDSGFVDESEPTHNCACGFSTKSSKAMDAHIEKAHPNG